MCAYGFLASNMIDVCFRDAKPAVVLRATTCAGAALFDGRVVIGVGGMAEIKDAGGCDGVSEALWDPLALMCWVR